MFRQLQEHRTDSETALPFPQDKELTLTESSDSPSDSVFFIPLLNHPLSSNFYYAIVAHGEFKGEAFTCSREEDVATCCFCCVYIKDTEPGPLDPHNIYQQFEIVPHKVGRRRRPAYFSAKSTGSPPSFLRDTATRWKSLREFGMSLDAIYVLVETFNLRRLGGSLLMSFHFKHFHHLKTIWE